MRRSTLLLTLLGALADAQRGYNSYDEVRQTLSSADLSSTDPSTRHRHRSAFSPPTLLRPGRRVADALRCVAGLELQECSGVAGGGLFKLLQRLEDLKALPTADMGASARALHRTG